MGSRARRPAVLAEPSARERVLWLLALLRRDVEELRPGEWLDLREDVRRYLWDRHYGAPEFNSAVREWHPEARRALEALWADRQWTLRLPLQRVLTHLRVQSSGAVLTVYKPLGLADGLLSATLDLLVSWFPKLRRCRHCETWFLPRHGRQQFHDPTCSARARWRRFAPTRTRDYHAEYAKRLKRAAPGAKPRRRRAATKGRSS